MSDALTQKCLEMIEQQDLKHLVEGSQIAPAVLIEAKIHSADLETTKKIVGVSATSIIFPYHDLQGELKGCRAKLTQTFSDQAGKQIKYLQPSGSSLSAFFLSSSDSLTKLNDASVPLLVTEGEKKALCAYSILAPNFAVASYPGCNNYGDKNGLSEIWDSLLIPGRTVVWIPDSDVFTNPRVAKAMARFLELMIAKRVFVTLVVLKPPKDSESPEEKIGLDDYVLKFGDTELKERIAEGWQLTSIDDAVHGITADESSVRNAIRSLAYLSKTEAEFAMHRIAKTTGLAKQLVSQVWKEIREEWSALHNVTSENYIRVDGTIKRAQIARNIAHWMGKNGNFFSYGDSVVLVANRSYQVVESNNFGTVLTAQGLEFGSVDRGQHKYETLSPSISKICLQGPYVANALNTVSVFSQNPIYDTQFNLQNPGYNLDPEIFYFGEAIEPSKSLALLNEFTAEINFRNEASRHNLFGILITMFLRQSFIGQIPLLALSGNRPGLGKSFIADLIGLILQGEAPRNIPYSTCDEEFGKAYCAAVRVADIVKIDNVKADIVSSQTLERTLTAKDATFRLLGLNKLFSRPNTILAIVTMNGCRLSRDLIERCIPVELFVDESIDLTKRVYSKSRLGEYVLENRFKILAELSGMIERWKRSGRHLATKNHRFGYWNEIVGGILEANGFNEFLTNYNTVTVEFDAVASTFGELFNGSEGKPLTADQLVNLARDKQLSNLFDGKLSPQKSLALSLTRYAEKTLFLSDGRKGFLKKGFDRHRKIATYQWVPIDGEPSAEVNSSQKEQKEHQERCGASASTKVNLLDDFDNEYTNDLFESEGFTP